MRIGLGPIPLSLASRSQLEVLARSAVAASFDSIWVAESREVGVGGGLGAAAMLAQFVPTRVGAVVDFGNYHPLYLAEDIAVADLTSGGRIEVLLRGGSEDQLQLLVEALSGAHLRFDRGSLRVPARLDENQPSPDRLALNPRPAQPVVPIWVEDGGAELAHGIGVGVAARWRKGIGVPAPVGRWPGMLLCPGDFAPEDLLDAARDSATYFVVQASTPEEAASAGRRLVGPLRMPDFPEWINRQ
jgi:alkanesulfonate monooxygenase SsuD/methylene tetrahydromethanopterin reductase-like flavin-dependent oxidoreductase (luciferase family)